MSRNQAEIRAANWTALAKTRQPLVSYRAEEFTKKDKKVEYAVIQYYGEEPVGIAAS